MLTSVTTAENIRSPRKTVMAASSGKMSFKVFSIIKLYNVYRSPDNFPVQGIFSLHFWKLRV